MRRFGLRRRPRRYRPGPFRRVLFVAIGHACSNLGRERQLHPDEWKQLLHIVLLSGLEIVLVGGPNDATTAAAIIAELGHGRNLCGKLTIGQSAKVLAGASSYYGIDFIPLHFARALEVPTVSVFGPTDPATRLRPIVAASGSLSPVCHARHVCTLTKPRLVGASALAWPWHCRT